MRRLLLMCAAVVGVLVITLVLVMVATLRGRQPITDGFETDGVRVIKDGMVTVGLLAIGDREVGLVDAGNDRSGRAILAELSRRGLGADAVKTILLTHAHPDHVGAVRLFPKAEIFALEPEVDLAEGRVAGRGPLQRFFPVRPTGVKVTRGLKDGETLTLGRMTIRVYSVPGHTAGSAAFLVNHVLFLGDSADVSTSGRIRGAPWVFSDDTARNRASVAHLADRLQREGAEVRVLVFSHSGPLTRGLEPLLTFARNP